MKFTAIGRVYPENAAVWFDRLERTFRHCGQSGRYTIECKVSQLLIVWDCPGVDDLDTAKIATDNLAQSYVSALGFAFGGGYSVDITLVIREDGQSHFFGPKTPALEFADTQQVFRDGMSLVARDPHFRFALIDYCNSLTNHVQSGWYCYRAVEAIACAFLEEGQCDKPDNQTWNRMHAALGTSKQDITSILKPKADPIRHGNWSNVPETTIAERLAACQLTRDVLKKYLEYRKQAPQ